MLTYDGVEFHRIPILRFQNRAVHGMLLSTMTRDFNLRGRFI